MGGDITAKSPSLPQVVAEVGYSAEALFQLLLHTAGLELKITQIYKRILHDKVTHAMLCID